MNTEELFINSKLPKPLPEEELQNLIKEAKNGSKEARDKWIIHNIKLVMYELTTKFQNVDYDKKELVSIGILGLIKAIDTYDLSKGVKFSSYATRCIDNEILMFLRKLKKSNNVDSLDKVVFHDKNGHNFKLEDYLSDDRDWLEEKETLILNIEIYKLIRESIKNLPDRNREIIMLYFGFYNDQIYTQEQIAAKMNISRPHVSRLITRIVKQIGKTLESKGLIELHSNPNEKPKKDKNESKVMEMSKTADEVANGRILSLKNPSSQK